MYPIQAINQKLFSAIGWKFSGNYPYELDKKMIIVAPHTSANDFFIGMIARACIKEEIRFLAKQSLFDWPLGMFMRWIGGTPVNRSERTNLVSSVVDMYEASDKLTIVMSPEGTRKKVEKFKTGYYYIAKQANIPIVLVRFHYPQKTIEFGEHFYCTDDSQADLNYIENYFRGTIGDVPEYSFF